MSAPTVHLDFGDGLYPFSLYPIGVVKEVESVLGVGVGVVFSRVQSGENYDDDYYTIIRMGLIGGGMAPTDALRKCEAYIRFMPYQAQRLLAHALLLHRYAGIGEKKEQVSETAAETPLTE
jgi:Phage tail tube protein, GTA-gp10